MKAPLAQVSMAKYIRESEVEMPEPRPDRQSWTPEEDRRLLELSDAGKTAPEIAKLLKRPPGAVRSRKHRLTAKDDACR